MSLKIRFTRNGRTVPSSEQGPPPGANDVHFEFAAGKHRPKFWYTRRRERIGDEHEAPANAKDIGVEFGVDERGRPVIGDTHWTDAQHNPIGGADGFIGPPEGADDWHFEVPGGQITDGFWTQNGKSFVPRSNVDIPTAANDAHLVTKSDRGNISRVLDDFAVASIDPDDPTALTELVSDRLAISRFFAMADKSLPAPPQPCGEVFSTTGEGEGTDDDEALDDAFTKAAFAAGRICMRNKNCTGAVFVKYIKVSFGGPKGARTCSIEAQFKCA